MLFKIIAVPTPKILSSEFFEKLMGQEGFYSSLFGYSCLKKKFELIIPEYRFPSEYDFGSLKNKTTEHHELKNYIKQLTQYAQRDARQEADSLLIDYIGKKVARAIETRYGGDLENVFFETLKKKEPRILRAIPSQWRPWIQERLNQIQESRAFFHIQRIEKQFEMEKIKEQEAEKIKERDREERRKKLDAFFQKIDSYTKRIMEIINWEMEGVETEEGRAKLFRDLIFFKEYFSDVINSHYQKELRLFLIEHSIQYQNLYYYRFEENRVIIPFNFLIPNPPNHQLEALLNTFRSQFSKKFIDENGQEKWDKTHENTLTFWEYYEKNLSLFCDSCRKTGSRRFQILFPFRERWLPPVTSFLGTQFDVEIMTAMKKVMNAPYSFSSKMPSSIEKVIYTWHNSISLKEGFMEFKWHLYDLLYPHRKLSKVLEECEKKEQETRQRKFEQETLERQIREEAKLKLQKEKEKEKEEERQGIWEWDQSELKRREKEWEEYRDLMRHLPQ